ncbi:MAG: caspase domain-containing protein [Elusimicrobiota bacterium]
MNDAIRKAVLLGLAAATAGCISPPSRVGDPFAEIETSKSIGQAAYPGVSLAYVLTPNSKNTLEYARASDWAHLWPGLDFNKPFDNMVAQLRANFKSVAKHETVDEARASGADLIGMVDLTMAVGTMATSFSVDEAVAFVDPAGGTLDKIPASAKRNTLRTGGVTDTALQQTVPVVIDDLREKFQSALTRSEALQSFARQHGGLAAGGMKAKTGRSDVDEPAYKAGEDANKFALVVGVENYETLPPADYAERDAASVRRHLLALGYPQRNVIYLTGQKAGKSGIEKYVESWLPRNVDENSSVFVYFSGHGSPDVKSGQAYLMPWDADAKFVESTGYPLKRLYQNLAALKAKRVLVALDSCFSGAGGRSVIAKGARPLMTHVEESLPSTDKMAVLAAASGDEITGSADAEGHGLFTYYLLKGLNERGGSVTVKSLYDYVRPQVQDAARRDNRDQTPQLLSSPGPASARF